MACERLIDLDALTLSQGRSHLETHTRETVLV